MPRSVVIPPPGVRREVLAISLILLELAREFLIEASALGVVVAAGLALAGATFIPLALRLLVLSLVLAGYLTFRAARRVRT